MFIFQVVEKCIPISNICVRVRGVGTLTVQQMVSDHTYTLLSMPLSGSTPVYPAESVIGSKNSELVNVGNSVGICTGPGEVIYT